MGLIFSNQEPKELAAYFENYRKNDYARAGFVATETIELPEGPLMCGVEPMVHSMEPTVRALGLPSLLKNGWIFLMPRVGDPSRSQPSLSRPVIAIGVVTLTKDHTLCKEGEPLTPEQAKILVGIQCFPLSPYTTLATVFFLFLQIETHPETSGRVQGGPAVPLVQQ